MSLLPAYLSALPKPSDRDLRLVAGWETVRLCTAKASSEAAREDVEARLEPLRMAVGTPMGAETSVHSAKDSLFSRKEDDDKVLAMLVEGVLGGRPKWHIRKPRLPHIDKGPPPHILAHERALNFGSTARRSLVEALAPKFTFG